MTLQTPSGRFAGTRRGFITGLGAFFCAAPAIVRATSLMPVRALEDCEFEYSGFYSVFDRRALADVTRTAFVPRLFVQLYAASPLMDEIIRLEVGGA